MPENARQGQPVWIDYVCHDLETTKNFYARVFGWDIVDQGPDFGHYHQIMKGQHPVGGFMQAMNMDGSPNPSIPACRRQTPLSLRSPRTAIIHDPPADQGQAHAALKACFIEGRVLGARAQGALVEHIGLVRIEKDQVGRRPPLKAAARQSQDLGRLKR